MQLKSNEITNLLVEVLSFPVVGFLGLSSWMLGLACDSRAKPPRACFTLKVAGARCHIS